MLALRISFLLVLPAQTLAQIGISTLFQVDFTTNENGGCQTYDPNNQENPDRDLFPNLLTDCLALAEAGVSAISDYGIKGEAERLVDVSFKETSVALRRQISHKFQDVRSFLLNKKALKTGTPWLFCNDDWLVRGNLKDQAKDKKGKPLYDRNGDPILVGDYYSYGIQSLIDTGIRQVFPYWSDRLKQYVFGPPYGNMRRDQGYCDEPANLAGTQDQTSPSSTTLCPRSFQRGTARLGTVAPNPVPKAAIEKAKPADAPNYQSLFDLESVPLTLFHELFHVVLTVKQTPDANTAKDVADLLGLPQAQALVNPETYTMVAQAYWYTQNKPVNDKVGFEIRLFTRLGHAENLTCSLLNFSLDIAHKVKSEDGYIYRRYKEHGAAREPRS